MRTLVWEKGRSPSRRVVPSWSGGIRGALLAAIVASCCLHARGAVAQTTDARLAISYAVPAECPSREQFVWAVVARTERVPQQATSGENALTVNVIRTATGFVGDLRLDFGNGQHLERSLEDGQCAALVEALALLAAMELAPVVADTQNRPPPDPRPATTNRQNPAAARAADATVSEQRDYRVALSGVAGLQEAPTPSPLPTFGMSMSMKRTSRVQEIGLSLQYGQTGLLRFDGGDVRFRWLALRLVGCPVGIKRRAFSVAACATTEFGILRGEPDRARYLQNRNGRWLAPGLGTLLSFEKARFLLEVFGGVIRPLQQDTFYFAGTNGAEQPEVVHVPPKLGICAELRLGTTF